MERLLIVDFDVHHGNGTQEAFYRDGAVYFLSIHRYPFYPGTGSMEEEGEGPGKGTTRNLPVPPGVPPDKIIEVFTSALNEAVEDHKPQLILASAGFDAYAGDPIGGLGLEPEHYQTLGEVIRDGAKSCCQGKVLSTLEGGYSLSGLPRCLVEYLGM
jgi:acetoin utilization deacetylase AcuC-like enzyme